MLGADCFDTGLLPLCITFRTDTHAPHMLKIVTRSAALQCPRLVSIVFSLRLRTSLMGVCQKLSCHPLLPGGRTLVSNNRMGLVPCGPLHLGPRCSHDGSTGSTQVQRVNLLLGPSPLRSLRFDSALVCLYVSSECAFGFTAMTCMRRCSTLGFCPSKLF